MKLLVTGGAGFIGSNFVLYWVKNHPEDKVVVLDKLTYAGNLANLESVKEKIEFIQGDICSPEDVAKAIAGCEVVVHFAAETHVDRSIKDPFIFVQTNVIGTQVLLEAAKRNQIKRFHHISTDEVFGHIPLESEFEWKENQNYNPRSPYSASKAASDHLVRAYFETYGLPVTITNCANNIGPFMFPEKFLPRAIIKLLKGEKIPVYTPGNQVREWLYVEDHCSAIEAVLEKGKVGETYFVGPNNKRISNLEVAKLLLTVMGKTEDSLELVADRPGHDQKYALDHSKISAELGWQPKYNLEESLQAMVNWYKNNETWWKDLYEKSENFYKQKGV